MIMNETPQSVVLLLDQATGEIETILGRLRDADDRRYTNGSLELIRRERNKLSRAIEVEDAESIKYALRSVLGMTKGVLDIGASWISDTSIAKQRFDEAMAEARRLVYGI